jgi:uncharacterized OsmC-like protein
MAEGINVLFANVADTGDRPSRTLHGPISDEQRASLYRAVVACPVHKLMTTTDVQIETVMP